MSYIYETEEGDTFAMCPVCVLNLPTPKGGGFQTPDRSGSRGPFRPRAGSRIASTPEARVQHLSADTRFATPEGDTPCAGVDREEYLPMHTRAALTAIATGTIGRGTTSDAAATTSAAAD
jgi:hypothetical protein